MPKSLTPQDVRAKAREVNERGYTLLPSFYTPNEIQRMAELLDAHWRKQGSPTMVENSFGFTIHPLIPSVPELAPFLEHQVVVDVLQEVLQDEVHLTHLGSRISNERSSERIPWHHHYAWDESKIAGRGKCERLLCGVYVEGSEPEVGPLIVYPRRFDEPIGPPRGAGDGPWEGEIHVHAPPGSVSIFDTALWHAAARGTNRGHRHIWGGHYQGWSDPRPHPEDNACDVPQLDDYLDRQPVLRSLIRGRGQA